jgi:hypothetical protein
LIKKQRVIIEQVLLKTVLEGILQAMTSTATPIDLLQFIVEQAVARIRTRGTFSNAELDLLLALSSRHTDRITNYLDDEEIPAFSGALRNRQEQLHAAVMANS